MLKNSTEPCGIARVKFYMGSYMTVRDVADKCRVRSATVLAWIRAGKLEAQRLPTNGYFRIPSDAVAELLK